MDGDKSSESIGTIELSALGEPLVDLGYKKVYKTNIATLVTIPIWEKQRTLRPSRSRFIAEAKIKSHNLNFAGIISAYFHPKSNDFGIIDGQHRLGALAILAESGHWKYDENNILLEVFEVKDEDEISDLFREINSAEPVRLVDMPPTPADVGDDVDGAIDDLLLDVSPVEEAIPTPIEADTTSTTTSVLPAVTNTANAVGEEPKKAVKKGKRAKEGEVDVAAFRRAVLEGVAEKLLSSYGDMFKDSQRCKPPHCNIDLLRDDLFQSRFISELVPEGLGKKGLAEETQRQVAVALERILQVNQQLCQEELAGQQKSGPGGKAYQAAWTKAQANGFYLGLRKGWADLL